MKKIYTLLGIALISGTSFAQSVNGQYEFMAVEKHSPNAITTVDGRSNFINQDRATYYSENFDAMTALDGSAGWTAVEQSGNVGFELTNTGHANDAGSSFTIPTMMSSTPTQWIVLDSDSQGQSGTDEDATLTSNVIDLTAGGSGVTAATPLKLEFEQFFAEWEQSPNYDTLYVGISDDGGATWNEVQISNNVGREGRPNPEVVSLNITSYVTNAANVQIRFRWDGNWAYGWQIDNVSIQDLPPNDISVVEVFRGDVVNSLMYSRVPSSQASEFVIGVVARNIGFNDQTNIGFDWEITDPNAGVLNGSSTMNLALLANGELDTIWVSTGMTPTLLGDYSIEFTLTTDQTDDEPANDVMTDAYYELTTDIYGAEYGTVKTPFGNWGGNTDAAASIGTVFLFPTDGVIGAVDVELNDDITVVDQLIMYTLYIFDADANAGDGGYVFLAETNEYTTVAADQGSFVRLFFDVQSVTAGDQIMATINYDGTFSPTNLMGKVAAGTTGGYSESAVSGTNGSGVVTLASPSAAILHLVMADFTGVEDVKEEKEVMIFPNPANSAINVELNHMNSENTTVNILDVTGKIIKTINVSEGNGNKTVTLSLEGLSNGVYFVEIINESSREVKKFTKK